ncbi:hypothetical protein BO94DRAFT_587303 [Aspergillus sclerotioniger CBS 115572]|uniref:Uncharacterized protein n=1 Tax=Aspergillus sclerotioniger CBS 115572 TaxID=1450535 RepID=A0A317W4V2_9EURO|nr:hypothetical protein BO94DRAFT_587303 [Aspergillus sclerotioniger CBS 115572]PWY81594.1 hypothetical protein BO94DRAFT_587303 [Aspergillus sclerotioniger CBS 115572]
MLNIGEAMTVVVGISSAMGIVVTVYHCQFPSRLWRWRESKMRDPERGEGELFQEAGMVLGEKPLARWHLSRWEASIPKLGPYSTLLVTTKAQPQAIAITSLYQLFLFIYGHTEHMFEPFQDTTPGSACKRGHYWRTAL